MTPEGILKLHGFKREWKEHASPLFTERFDKNGAHFRFFFHADIPLLEISQDHYFDESIRIRVKDAHHVIRILEALDLETKKNAPSPPRS